MRLTASSLIILPALILTYMMASAATVRGIETAPCASGETLGKRVASTGGTPGASGSTRANKEGQVSTLYAPAWSPDGLRLTFEAKIGDKWVLMVMRADGAGLRQLTEARYTSHSSSWSPDGTRIIFTSDRDGNTDLYHMNPDGSNVRRLTSDAAKEASPRYSPDGRFIAYKINRDGRNEVYVMKSDGSQPTRVTPDTLDIVARIAWSPDGKISFFAVERKQAGAGVGGGEGAPTLLWTVKPDGSGLTRIGATPARDYNPSWSPDGRTIAFDAHRDGAWESADGGWEIWVKNSDGSGRRRLTDNSINDWGPAWSPDGSLIAYCSGINDKYEIWVMRADGSASKRLTHLVYGEFPPGQKR